MNFLYYGDNLKILREQVASETVDLSSLNPPCWTSMAIRTPRTLVKGIG
jgi:hypothetical protein